MSDGQEDRYLAEIDKLKEANKVVHRALLEIGAKNIKLKDELTEVKDIAMSGAESIGDYREKVIELELYIEEFERLAKDDKLWKEKVNIDTLKSLLREYKKTIDKIKLACPKWQIAELEEILSPRQNGFDIHD